MYVQLLELWKMAKFHAQIWQFWKWAHILETDIWAPHMCVLSAIKNIYILETAALSAKISSILTIWGIKGVYMYVQLLELWPVAKFHAQIRQF